MGSIKWKCDILGGSTQGYIFYSRYLDPLGHVLKPLIEP
jgi:hypothetical protein